MAKWIAALFLPFVALAFGLGLLFYHPETPLSDAWNPTKPLNPTAQPNAITNWKLKRALSTKSQCFDALSKAHAGYSSVADKTESDICHIRNRTLINGIGSTRLAQIDTKCEMALRFAMWNIHSVQPAARSFFQTDVKRIHHFGSYSCRKINGSTRMSEHATANALDISGVELANGQRIMLKNDWDGDKNKRRFLRQIRKGACDWFRLVLSPDYNAAHYDHFHFDQGRWGGCK